MCMKVYSVYLECIFKVKDRIHKGFFVYRNFQNSFHKTVRTTLAKLFFKSLTLYNTLLSCLCDIPFVAYLGHWLCGRGAATANKSYLWSRINLKLIKEGIQGIPTCTLLLAKVYVIRMQRKSILFHYTPHAETYL